MKAHLLQSTSQESIYIGGGTPTVLSCAQLSRLFDGIEDLLIGPHIREITVEANPDTISPEKCSLLLRRGVTRLSLGIQSFADDVLASLGRPHSAADAVTAFLKARAAGFQNIGFDLIYGIPGLTSQQWLDTIGTALSLRPEHLSLYGLSLDEGSRLSRDAAAGLVHMPDDESSAAQYEAAVAILARAGYEQYEISNFCIPGHACLHNSNYWARGEYLGLGPGAWSSLGRRRSANVPSLDDYVSRIGSGTALEAFEEHLCAGQEAVETLILGMRTTRGIDLERYASLAGGEAAAAVRQRLNEMEGSGLFRTEGARVMLTTRGMLLSNDILSRIIP